MDSYAKYLQDRGYDQKTGRRKLRTIARFSPWLKRHGVQVRNLSVDEIHKYLSMKVRKGRPPTKDDGVELKQFLEFLRTLEAAPQSTNAPSSGMKIEDVVFSFAVYLKRERSLSAGSVVQYKRYVQRFVSDMAPDGRCNFSTLLPATITSYVCKAAANQSRKDTKLMTSALRSFLRFARYQAFIETDLAAAVPAVANWAVSLPKALPTHQVEQILSSCDRKTIIGKRDFAIVLLLARLGLRAGEISSLQLEDIHWETGCISIHGKGSNLTQMPLPPDVGNALSSYLLCRPKSSSRAVFLRTIKPFIGFSNSSTVSGIVQSAFRRTGLDADSQGSHQFRHTLATELLRKGSSLQEIAELLRHQTLECTTIYAKVDFSSLRSVGLPWPGGAAK
ncbi:MAG: integrase [Candidatus Melainabacteria bacterium]|nr:MAG: integrase [Candidatus Melainabacteria bacterium]